MMRLNLFLQWRIPSVDTLAETLASVFRVSSSRGVVLAHSTTIAMQGWQANVNGTDLWNMLQQSFGWVTSSGYTSRGNVTTQFPVVVGEFGSNYADPLVRLLSIIFAMPA